MASFRDSFHHFKIQAWLTDLNNHSDNPQLPSHSPQSRKRKRKYSNSGTTPPSHHPEPQYPSSPTPARRPLQVITRVNMAERAGEDSGPVKRPKKLIATRTTPVILPDPSPKPRRQSPRRIGSAPSPAVNHESGQVATSEQGLPQGDAGMETRGRAMDGFSPNSNIYTESLRSGIDAFPLSSALPSQSSRQRSSTSPSKRMTNLAMANPPIRFYEADAILPPKGVADLYHQIVRACSINKLLPYSLKDEIVPYSKSQYLDLYDINFQDKPKSYEADTAGSSPGNTIREDFMVWEEVKRIRQMALKCSQDNASEAARGERVYSRILHSALETFHLRESVGWENITTARIEPRTLKPKHLTGKNFASKMVDYAFILLPDKTMYRAILDALRQSLDEDEHNINQTSYEPVRFKPITVNVEVKVPGAGKNQTMVQLSVWVAAQFQKLNSLTGERLVVEDICIPLISVEGHDWRVYIACQAADGEVIIWGNQLFGDTGSVLGIYRVIAGLRVLAEWSHSDYRPWFMEKVLQMGR